MKKLLKIVCVVFVSVFLLTITTDIGYVHGKEIEETEETEETSVEDGLLINEFFAYMQHSYKNYNIFWSPFWIENIFLTDEQNEYRPIDTDKKDVTGNIAVICYQAGDDEERIETNESDETDHENEDLYDTEADAPISYYIQQNEQLCIDRIYSGEHKPTTLNFTYIQADTLEADDFRNYDLYIFEESAKDMELTDEMFLSLEALLKSGETFIYDSDYVSSTFATGEQEGSSIVIISKTSTGSNPVLLMADNTKNSVIGFGGKMICSGTPKYKESANEKMYWPSAIHFLASFNSHGAPLDYPLLTVKILPTSKTDTSELPLRDKNLGLIKNIYLPSTIKTIVDDTFNGHDVLEHINLEHVTYIGKRAFYNCYLLKNITFNEREDVIIEESAFEHCGLTNITIPTTIKKIPKSAFANNYETNPLSLLNYGSTLSLFYECQKYIEKHPDGEEKELSLDTVTFDIASDTNMDIERNAFFPLRETCTVNFIDQDQVSAPLYQFTNNDEEKWVASELFASQLCMLKNISCVASHELTGQSTEQLTEQSMEQSTERRTEQITEQATEQQIEQSTEESTEQIAEPPTDTSDANQEENMHSVTFVDTRARNNAIAVLPVENGTVWGNYLPKLSGLEYTKVDLRYDFVGWETDDNHLIQADEVVDLDSNIKLYSKFKFTGEELEKTYKVQFQVIHKTISVKLGTTLHTTYNPPQRKNDKFIGWSSHYPIEPHDTLITEKTILMINLFDNDKLLKLYPIYESDLIEPRSIKAKDILNGKPIYRLNDNNIGTITDYGDGTTENSYYLEQTNFYETDKKNAENIKNKIMRSGKEKIAILPKGYRVNVEKLKKSGYEVIKTNLELDDYISALTYMNCRYFQYLQMIQTPYFENEEQLTKWDKKGVGYHFSVADFELSKVPSESKGFIYYINQNKYVKYYNMCMGMEHKLQGIASKLKFHKDMAVTDALWAIKSLVTSEYAYDTPLQIYDLHWMLEDTNPNRNKQYHTNHHGVCASYSKLACALLGLYGYDAPPTAVGNETTTTHSVNQVVLDGKTYYCDYTWVSANSDRFMFMTSENMIFSNHMHPKADDMGKKVSYSRRTSNLQALKIKSAKNTKEKKLTICYNKIKNADGYQIQYSTKKDFKNAKMKDITKAQVTLANLKKYQTYYVRIRPYKFVSLRSCETNKIGAVKYFGPWSSMKSAAIKK
ncbi:MAG: leucine-rich repeat protein [Eubacteriales bacterium]|nr:leucine-rich repeat protein [Eubacteriales bacterium]